MHKNAMKASADYSRFVRRVRRRYAAQLPLLPVGVPDTQRIIDLIDRLQKQGYSLAASLRITRQLVIERLAVLDIEMQASLDEVMHAMSDLAEVALKLSLQYAQQELDALYGSPCCEDGTPCNFWVMGMGKLGGRELNVSSDIDLVYLYDEAGQTTGKAVASSEEDKQASRRSNHEYFGYLAKILHKLIGEVTEHGFVFRMDLALRPNGKSGPIAMSLPMLKTYFQMHGRDWERFAWMKARVVAMMGNDSEEKHAYLRQIIHPFVYRSYLDFNVLESLRQTHAKIRQQAVERIAGHPERANDVKLSRGGIRELEFTVQLYQVIRGGQLPEIRTSSTLLALAHLEAMKLLPTDKVQQLIQAYIFLRRLEHRIQYLDDQQTHTLPQDDQDIEWIALSLFDDTKVTQCGIDVVTRLFCLLDESREHIADQFDDLLFLADEQIQSGNPCSSGICSYPPEILGDTAFEARLPDCVQEQIHHWAQSTRIKNLKEKIKINLTYLISRTAQWFSQEELSPTAFLRFLDWLDTILRRENYQMLLLERPAVHLRLLRILGQARWAALYLKRHPGVIDELSDKRAFEKRFDHERYEKELLIRRAALKNAQEEDEESLLNVLRRAYHIELFRTLARDIEGYLTVEQVADDLSALTDSTLKIALQWCWDYYSQRHQTSPMMGIIAYGKLGGIELGYGSDLDLVFIYDDPNLRAGEIYAAYVRKLIQWLTVKTTEGDLFEIDTALRPNGNSGLLVTSLESFETYQLGRGSNTAWTWEHQALTRARCVVGNHNMRERFDAVRQQVIMSKRDISALKQEVLSMHERVKISHPIRPGLMDVKYSPGGMLDIEFCVQFLVLAHASRYPELEEDVGNIALLHRAEKAGLIPAPYGQQAADAYRMLRKTQHQIRLDDVILFNEEAVSGACDAGLRLWQKVLC